MSRSSICKLKPGAGLQDSLGFSVFICMARRLRWVPEGGALVDVSCGTVQGRYLFRPSPELNEVALGVLGRTQRLYPIRICCLAVLSSHLHILVDADDACQLADFMEYACSNLAKEVGRLTDWE